jgi:cytochrome P450
MTANKINSPVSSGPSSDLDLFSDEVLLDPYPTYCALREQGGAVWLSQIGMHVLTRYADVRDALANWQIFSSAKGVMMNQQMNDALRGIVLCSDPPEHDVMRKVLMKPLSPVALRILTDRIKSEAETLVERLVAKRSFDAATELAQHLPITIVSDLVGLPEEGRERMLDWAAANFNCFGPLNQRTVDAFETVKEMLHYAFNEAVPGKLKPGGWAAMIYEAADRGEIRHDQCPVMMNDYMGPSLDTTIFATSSAIWLFANNPDQWDALRERPSLIPNAVNEIVRIESPIQNFSRVLTIDYDIDGLRLPAGSRTIVSYGAANRDPRKWVDPDRFDIHRREMDHVGFGHGVHQCMGNNLARMEISALLNALVKRVRRFDLGSSERQLNNVLRGFRKLEVTVN